MKFDAFNKDGQVGYHLQDDGLGGGGGTLISLGIQQVLAARMIQMAPLLVDMTICGLIVMPSYIMVV